MSSGRGALWRYTLQSVAVILLLAILIRSFLFSSYVMSGASMLPSIWPGDFLLGTRLRVQELRRGEVVAMRCPLVKDKLCLKRVVGLGGDHIEYKNEQLIVNGVLARYLPVGAFQTEVLGGQSWSIWPEPTPVEEKGAKSLPAVTVPPASVYLLNDKRADHDDSRQWGPVSNSFVEARILGVWLSLDWYESEHVRAWPRLRWARIFTGL